jgi:hypothetical protein
MRRGPRAFEFATHSSPALPASSSLILQASSSGARGVIEDLFRLYSGSSKDLLRLQGSIKLSFMVHMNHEIFVLVQKDSNAKKERLCTKFTTQNKKAKKKIYPDNFVLP